MNKKFFKSLPLVLLTLVLGLSVGCSYGHYGAPHMSMGEGSQIPPKASGNTADMAADAEAGEEIRDKPEEEPSQFWLLSTDDSTSMASRNFTRPADLLAACLRIVN